MTVLDGWLKQATRHLSKDSVAQVRTEIQEHYESTRDAAMNGGATADEADGLALGALGDAGAANCQYRKVLLTAAEARLLAGGNCEAQAFCSRPFLRWLLLAMPMAAMFAATAFFIRGEIATAGTLLAGAIALAVVFAGPFLPVYTPLRARILRCVKWIVLSGTLAFAFQWSWLFISCIWPLAWIELMRISIRRKLPVAQWPKQLYL